MYVYNGPDIYVSDFLIIRVIWFQMQKSTDGNTAIWQLYSPRTEKACVNQLTRSNELNQNSGRYTNLQNSGC